MLFQATTLAAFLSATLCLGGPADTAAKSLDVWGPQHETENRVDDARTLFDSIRHLNLQTPDAAAKLRELGARENEVSKAMRDYERARTGDTFFAQLDPSGGTLYENYKKHGDVVRHILTALGQGGPLAAVHSYFMSFLLDEQGLAQEAGYFFNRAELMKRLASDSYFAELPHPLDYEFPALFEKLGVPRFSDRQLRVLRFVDDETLKTEHYMAVNSLDQGDRHAAAALLLRYDSNFVQAAGETALPATIATDSGTAQTVFANLGARTSPVRPLSAGVDLYAVLDRHTRDDLGYYDTMTALPSVWVSSWNSTNNELRLRYDYAATFRDRASLRALSIIHGPQLTWAHLWDRRYQAVAEYSYKRARYPGDETGSSTRLTGLQHAVGLKVAYPVASKRVQPFARYRFTHDWPEGSALQSNTHSLELGTVYLLSRAATLNFSTTFGYAFFPNGPQDRRDQLRQARLGAAYRFFDALTLLFDLGYATQRFNVSLGPSFSASF